MLIDLVDASEAREDDENFKNEVDLAQAPSPSAAINEKSLGWRITKRRFQQRTPLVMGLWSAALMGGGGLGAAITPWLVQHSETWYQTLAWWALPAVVALFAWWWQSAREVASSHKTTTTPVRVVFTPRAWTLGVYFGLINGGYASLIAWLPAFYIEIGASAQYSGSLLALMGGLFCQFSQTLFLFLQQVQCLLLCLLESHTLSPFFPDLYLSRSAMYVI